MEKKQQNDRKMLEKRLKKYMNILTPDLIDLKKLKELSWMGIPERKK